MARLDLNTLRLYETMIGTKIPGFEVQFKDESWFMRALGVLTSPFNPAFMTQYTTTIGKTVYFPSKASYEKDPGSSMCTLFHESVHLWDSQEHTTFKLSYLFPQILGLLPLLAFILLSGLQAWPLLVLLLGYVTAALVAPSSKTAFWVIVGTSVLASLTGALLFTGWKVVLLFGVLASVLPWPAPWRARWELRGYTASLAFQQWVLGKIPEESLEKVRHHFTSPDYFFMSWSRADTAQRVDEIRGKIEAGDVQGLPPFEFTYDFLYRNGLLRRA